mmetsp:Transcript_44415/g.125728  ORF Transcript_44415/g.125728 Transcript_44415/m.125728 type:complete len:230 (+) Transcript_44415:918-1607(+)
MPLQHAAGDAHGGARAVHAEGQCRQPAHQGDRLGRVLVEGLRARAHAGENLLDRLQAGAPLLGAPRAQLPQPNLDVLALLLGPSGGVGPGRVDDRLLVVLRLHADGLAGGLLQIGLVPYADALVLHELLLLPAQLVVELLLLLLQLLGLQRALYLGLALRRGPLLVRHVRDRAAGLLRLRGGQVVLELRALRPLLLRAQPVAQLQRVLLQAHQVKDLVGELGGINLLQR